MSLKMKYNPIYISSLSYVGFRKKNNSQAGAEILLKAQSMVKLFAVDFWIHFVWIFVFNFSKKFNLYINHIKTILVKLKSWSGNKTM